jgi:hypothetical protein
MSFFLLWHIQQQQQELLRRMSARHSMREGYEMKEDKTDPGLNTSKEAKLVTTGDIVGVATVIGVVVGLICLIYFCAGAMHRYDEWIAGQWSEKKPTIFNVEKVLMHRRGEYSVLILEENKELKPKEFYDPKLIADVSAGEPMYIKALAETCTWGQSEGSVRYSEVEIHVHPDDIEGGTWRRKVGKNHWVEERTNVVE